MDQSINHRPAGTISQGVENTIECNLIAGLVYTLSHLAKYTNALAIVNTCSMTIPQTVSRC